MTFNGMLEHDPEFRQTEMEVFRRNNTTCFHCGELAQHSYRNRPWCYACLEQYRRRPQFIYWLRFNSLGRVKIGVTGNVEKRRQELSKACGEELVLLAVLPGTYEDEQEIHSYCSEERLAWGEWFREGPLVLKILSLLPNYSSARELVERVINRPQRGDYEDFESHLEFHMRWIMVNSAVQGTLNFDDNHGPAG